MNKSSIAFPSLKKDTKLLDILNHKELISTQIPLKQRIVPDLIYSAGLQGQEVINLKIPDMDFERKTIHIRQSKYEECRKKNIGHSGIYLNRAHRLSDAFKGRIPDSLKHALRKKTNWINSTRVSKRIEISYGWQMIITPFT